MMAQGSTYQKARTSLNRLKIFFLPARGLWILALAATALAAATEPMMPALLKPLLDRGFEGAGRVQLWLVPTLLVLLFGVRAAAGFVSQYALARIVNLGLQGLRDALFSKMLTAHLSLYDQRSASALTSTVVYEVQTGSTLLINSLVRAVRDALTLLALVAYLLYLNWKLSLVVALMLPPIIFSIRLLTKRLYQLTLTTKEATVNLAYVVEENVLAQRDIRLHQAQTLQRQRFAKLSNLLRQLSLKTVIAQAGMSALTQVLAALALSAVITIAIVQSAEGATTVGGFVAFITAMLLLIAPLKSLAEIGGPLTRGIASIEGGLALLDNFHDESGGKHKAERARGEIELRAVTVQYRPETAPALDQVDLRIRAGQTVALVGTSGSGKTTLANLLPRLIERSSGEVKLDGVDVAEWNLANLRSQFAFVSQHVIMLNDSLAVNVALGQEPERERVKQCLMAADLGQLLSELPQGVDTVLGHNAMQLSGGQRQRLAIARALYKDAPILLLDEATSALDSESEKIVQQAIESLCQGRTSLIIAHRLSTIEHADMIVVLIGGRIAEMGTHQQLLAIGGHYSQLHGMGLKSDASRQSMASPDTTQVKQDV
jgi:subfamily B ATP-binding cassette protein MsbA